MVAIDQEKEIRLFDDSVLKITLNSSVSGLCFRSRVAAPPVMTQHLFHSSSYLLAVVPVVRHPLCKTVPL